MLSVCFLTAHPGPANHFVEYAKVYEERGVPYHILSGDTTAEKFTCAGLKVSVLTDEEHLKDAQMVIFDTSQVERAASIKERFPGVKRVLYYDNPDAYVPGGYSESIAKAAKVADAILFANTNFISKPIFSSVDTPIDLQAIERMATGYFPLQEAEKIAAAKDTNEAKLRTDFFAHQALKDEGQRIVTYLGGANPEYYEKAFPAFCEMVFALNPDTYKDVIFVIQQHPRARQEGNPDLEILGKYGEEGPIVVTSKHQTIDAVAISDQVYYYQTSMAAQVAFAKILPIQIGHQVNADVMVTSGFPVVTNVEMLSRTLQKKEGIEGDTLDALTKALGVDPNWKERIVEIAK